ncbi:hypothetical protein [Methylobacterium sp. 10]|uniref:hypothetical protein n=1 Tax=Methylobacterium sp. 10 TaxID=1101191 RepID=UPI0004879889|nr:hypothetical protein [Methylobacterium sp. 10]
MSEAYLAAHAAVAAEIKAADPLISPAVHSEFCKLVADHIQIGADGDVNILDSEGRIALDDTAGYQNMTLPGFMRRLKDTRPWLFSEGARRPDKPLPPVSKPPKSLTDAMIVAKRDPDALAEFERSKSPSSKSKPAAGKVNLTDLMRRYKQGDPSAIQYIQTVK